MNTESSLPTSGANAWLTLFGLLEREGVTPGPDLDRRASASPRWWIPAPGSSGVAARPPTLRRPRLERDLGLVAVVGESVGGDRLLAESAMDQLRAAHVEVREAWIGARRCSQAFLVAARESAARGRCSARRV